MSTKVDPLDFFPTFYNMQSVTSNAVSRALNTKFPRLLFQVTNDGGTVLYYKASGLIPTVSGESVYFIQARAGELIVLGCGHGDGSAIQIPKAKRLLNTYSKIAGLRYSGQTLYFALSAYSHEVIFTRMAGNINTDVSYQSVSASEYTSATEITIET